MEGTKYDNGKIQWSYFPWEEAEEVARVVHEGAKKYEPYNWKLLENGEQRYIDAAVRHLVAHIKGESINKEDFGLSHLAHAACSILFAMHFVNKKAAIDKIVRKASGSDASNLWKYDNG